MESEINFEKLSKSELIELLNLKEQKIKDIKKDLLLHSNKTNKIDSETRSNTFNPNSLLDNHSIKRYSRQLLLPEFGIGGQKKLGSSSILIVGCGGLGCPSAIYLAGAGIGKLGLVDFDNIEISNIHRQILHSENRVGMPKVYSISKSVQELNSNVICETYITEASSQTIMDIITHYDVVLDCTDNVATRYLLNDACILIHKPLVSGSALKFEGQLTVYGYKDGPCYRCLFPKPPPVETVTNCSDGGVMGPIPGVIGCLQAVEAIKILTNIGEVCSKKMILFDSLTMSFQSIQLRGKQSSCHICSTSPKIHSLIDYTQFCGSSASSKDKSINILPDDKRITVQKYKSMIEQNNPHLLLDVRSTIEVDICKLPNCINIPIKSLGNAESNTLIEKLITDYKAEQIVCICRRGNDSQKAVLSLESSLKDLKIPIFDVIGGLTEWAKEVDKKFPIY